MANKFLSLNTSGKKTLTAPAAGDIASGTLAAARMPAFSGDATSSAGAVTLALATVNSNVGTFGSSSAIPVVTVNAKGLVTAVSTAAASGGGSGISTLFSVDTLSGQQSLNGSGAISYAGATPTVDTASGWNKTNGQYTIPTKGYYLVTAWIRYPDGQSSINVGQDILIVGSGAGLSYWEDSGGYSKTSLMSRVAHFNAGDVVQHAVYFRSSGNVLNAEMSLVLLIAG